MMNPATSSVVGFPVIARTSPNSLAKCGSNAVEKESLIRRSFPFASVQRVRRSSPAPEGRFDFADALESRDRDLLLRKYGAERDEVEQEMAEAQIALPGIWSNIR